jgi:hypothetical protein
MNNFNEPKISDKEQQDQFNKRFLIKLMLFMFLYRFYIMNIDQKGILIDCAEECLDIFDKKQKEVIQKEFIQEEFIQEEVILDELD